MIVVAQIVCTDLQWSTASKKLSVVLIFIQQSHSRAREPAVSTDHLSFLNSICNIPPLLALCLANRCWLDSMLDLRRCCCSFWYRRELFAKYAIHVREYLHMGIQTRRRLKFITIAAAREKQSPICNDE